MLRMCAHRRMPLFPQKRAEVLDGYGVLRVYFKLVVVAGTCVITQAYVDVYEKHTKASVVEIFACTLIRMRVLGRQENMISSCTSRCTADLWLGLVSQWMSWQPYIQYHIE